MKRHELGEGNQGEQAADNGWAELENYAPEQNGSDLRANDSEKPTGERRHDAGDAEKDFNRLLKGEKYSVPDSPEKIKAETAQLQKKSEEYDKFFALGATPELIKEIKGLDQKIMDDKDPDGKAQLAARRKELVDVAIANGKTVEH